MVHDQIILTLRKSNIPAYAAPTLEAKKVGSLSKYTQLNVIGTWDDVLGSDIQLINPMKKATTRSYSCLLC